MDNRLWRIISYIFHPVFMPAIGAFILMRNDPMLFFSLSSAAPWLIVLGTIISCTVLFPMLFCWALIKTGKITNLEQPTDADRRYMIICTELGFLLVYLAFRSIPETGRALSLYMLGLNITMIATLCISFIKRSSFHATGAGGILGTVIGIAWYSRINMNYWIGAVILLSILIGYARYKLKAHDEFEIYTGYLVGILSMALVFILGANNL